MGRGPFIIKIINNSLTTGYIPAAFKKAYITPLVKKPGLNEDKASSFRPVSSLSVFSKTLERAVSRQLERHLNSADGDCSSTGVLRHHHTSGQGEYALTAFLDLSAAFDIVDRDILLHCVPKKTVVPNFGDNFVKS